MSVKKMHWGHHGLSSKMRHASKRLGSKSLGKRYRLRGKYGG